MNVVLECRKHSLRFEQPAGWMDMKLGAPACWLCMAESLKAESLRVAEVENQRDLLLAAIELKLTAEVKSFDRSKL